MKKILHATTILVCATFLVACGPREKIVEKPVAVTVHVPESIRTCPAIPKPGVTANTDQKDVADWAARLYGVAKTCKANLRAVDKVLDDYEADPLNETEKAGFPPL